MKITTIREFKNRASALLKGPDPLLVTRHGKTAGVYLPVLDSDSIPLDLVRDLQKALARSVNQAMAVKGLTEESVLADFESSRNGKKSHRSL